ncbi:MAG: right-handed parallel beta-helix repeat-containing protein [Candidatus Thorarchaeota archaeon]
MHQKWYILPILLTLLCINILTPIVNLESSNEFEKNYRISQDFIPHDVIEIEGNSELLSQAALEGWPGNGTADDPIIIQGYSFVGPLHHIWMWGTTLHVEIRNNTLDGVDDTWCVISLIECNNILVENNTMWRGAVGVHLTSAQNITIHDNTIDNSLFIGVVVEEREEINEVILTQQTENIVIDNNRIFDAATRGIALGGQFPSDRLCESVVVSRNEIYDNPLGIDVQDTNAAHIWGNTIHHNSGDGIQVQSNANATIIEDNQIYSNLLGIEMGGEYGQLIQNDVYQNMNGIRLTGSNNQILNNTVRSNSGDGLDIRLSSYIMTAPPCIDNIVQYNIFEENLFYGLAIEEEVDGTQIHYNDFIENGELNQTADSGNNSNYTHNFYSHWQTPDNDTDGFVDLSCPIDGISLNADPLPLASPYNWQSPIVTTSTTSTTVTTTVTTTAATTSSSTTTVTSTTTATTPTSTTTPSTTPIPTEPFPVLLGVVLITGSGFGVVIVVILLMRRR